jgi:hypothetical protein
LSYSIVLTTLGGYTYAVEGNTFTKGGLHFGVMQLGSAIGTVRNAL